MDELQTIWDLLTSNRTLLKYLIALILIAMRKIYQIDLRILDFSNEIKLIKTEVETLKIKIANTETTLLSHLENTVKKLTQKEEN